MKVSIVSTVYNKELFLSEHIESLIKQNYEDIEFIFVNDGSDDNSQKILNDYKAKDKRILVINQDNQGPSIARKTGFIKSTGDLIYFVDSDDTLYNDSVISNIVKIFNENKNIDFVIGQMYNSYDSKNVLDKVIYSDDVSDGIYEIDYLYDKSFRLSLCYKVIKRSLINEEDFIPSRVYEDGVLTYRIYNRAKKFYYYENPIYLVNRKKENKNRITNSINSEKVIEKYKNIDLLMPLEKFSVSLKRLRLQSYLDDLNYALKLNFKDKVELLNLAKGFLSEEIDKREYLIQNDHYKSLYKYRFLYSKPILNFIISIIKALKDFLKKALKMFLRLTKKTILFLPNILMKLNKKLKILFYKIKYGDRLSIGKNFTFRKNFIINISKGGHLKIGDNNFSNNYCTINCKNNIVIGDDNIFGENVKFYDHDHLFNDLNKDMKTNFTLGSIKIGKNNWFCTNVVVLRNTTIENNTVIGAGVTLKGHYDSDKLIKSDKGNTTEDINYKKMI